MFSALLRSETGGKANSSGPPLILSERQVTKPFDLGLGIQTVATFIWWQTCLRMVPMCKGCFENLLKD